MGDQVIPEEPTVEQLAEVAAHAGPDIQVVADPQGRIRYASAAAARILHRMPNNDGRGHILNFVHPHDGATVLATIDALSSRMATHRPITIRVRDAGEEWVECEVSGSAVPGPGGAWVILSVRFVAERNRTAARQADLQRLIHSASVEFARARWHDAQEVTENLLRSLCGVLGAELAEVAWAEQEEEPLVVGAGWAVRSSDARTSDDLGSRGATFEPLCPDVESARSGVAICDDLAMAAGTSAAERFTGAGLDAAVELPLSIGHPCAVMRLGFSGGLGVWDDINTEPTTLIGRIVLSSLRRCRTEEELHERARRDSLTGLFNRDEFYRHLEGAVTSARDGGQLGVLFCDVDGFKATNDDLGHACGDEVLRVVADVLQQSVREGDTVARVGGDEFVALCRSLEHPRQLDAIAERLTERVEELQVEGRSVSLSVGAAVLGDDQGVDQLLGAADAAMYRTKRGRPAGRNSDLDADPPSGQVGDRVVEDPEEGRA